MGNGLLSILQKEARAGFPRMRGGRVHATVPVREGLLNHLLAKLGVTIELHADNRILLSWRGVRAAAQVMRITPDLTVVLSTSWLARIALRGVLTWKPGLQTYLAQQDRHVLILCGRIPSVANVREYWRHISHIDVSVRPGMLVLHVDTRFQ